MNFFKKTSLLLLLTATFFQSCESNESCEDVISDELAITTDLSEKIITTATSLNDVNFLEKYAVNGCDFEVIGYFRNPEGYNSEQLFFVNGVNQGWSLPAFYEEKQSVFESTGVKFTNDDFFITALLTPDPGTWVNSRFSYNRISHMDYFDDCSYEEDEGNYVARIPLSEVNFDCNDETEAGYLIQGTSFNVRMPLASGLVPIENELITYNSEGNTSFTLDDVTVGYVLYKPLHSDQFVMLQEEKDILNYFNNCSLARDVNDNDCLNFVYPLEINRINSASEEIISVNNDDDLVTIFNTTEELTFVFPINLLGQDGTTLTIETNDELESALDTSANYCD